MNLQELYDWIFHQQADGAGLSMKTVGMVLGVLLLLSHLWAWLRADQVKEMAKEFPRHRFAGIALLAVCLLWCWFLVSCMDMGEFYTWRRWLMMLVPISFVLVITYVPEFLAVRALGTLMILAASPVLHSAFLQPQTSRLLLPTLAYVWAIAGMFLVGLPYLMRDWIDWLSKAPVRWNLAALGGAAYGAVLFVVAVVDY
ncbi:hypothetical protein AYO49_05590 [Verrucomicrobiaceae bacterium SCGC AG-212-N21]|nr:hypothetical protein AYO49_05590 [Verrucomicrobiaceae bacterium SCGC AG-212-N21]